MINLFDIIIKAVILRRNPTNSAVEILVYTCVL